MNYTVWDFTFTHKFDSCSHAIDMYVNGPIGKKAKSNSLTYLLTHLLTHLLIHLLTHLLTYLLTYLLTKISWIAVVAETRLIFATCCLYQQKYNQNLSVVICARLH